MYPERFQIPRNIMMVIILFLTVETSDFIFVLLFNGLLKNYSNRRQRQNYRNSNNIKSTMYKKKKIDIKTITQKKRRSL